MPASLNLSTAAAYGRRSTEQETSPASETSSSLSTTSALNESPTSDRHDRRTASGASLRRTISTAGTSGRQQRDDEPGSASFLSFGLVSTQLKAEHQSVREEATAQLYTPEAQLARGI